MIKFKHKIKERLKTCIIDYFQMQNIFPLLICDIIFSVYLLTKSLKLKLKSFLIFSPREINDFTIKIYSFLSNCFSKRIQHTVCFQVALNQTNEWRQNEWNKCEDKIEEACKELDENLEAEKDEHIKMNEKEWETCIEVIKKKWTNFWKNIDDK
ncbi:hypothetical protein C922_01460 [Plasmodium inui San Antonio 1]|uniref:Uncharacterized protein n=1 Tax=Plasmodium inui San Antonio 1 TaxID=1237626 RepID=W7A9A4_9APIC|nr:hypothetical protein C922_01460 [Plasmodium inui San Antonio 1]EUD67848.1 hypothetical protein C922_01460 [Plasmodium inui San Antonio 1]